MSKPLLYRIARPILGPIFKFYYKPTIIGKENLNIEGPAIITSDHIHLFDQCHMIISTKNILTYMAKREYFDSKKTAWFFKGVGCIPVDRAKKDTNAVESALEVLNNKGYIGIFPEGTRNALKEERVKPIYDKYFTDLDYNKFVKDLMDTKVKLSRLYFLESLLEDKRITEDEYKDNILRCEEYINDLYKDKKITEDEYFNSMLLDFKFGAVSMASKTDAYLVPCAITGDYRFRSKNLKVRFGKPFKVGNMELDKANKKLFDETIKLMKKNIKGE